MTIQVYFADGVPSELEGVTLTELFVLVRLVKLGRAKVTCPFKCGRRTISLDVGQVNTRLTFGSQFSEEDYP